MAIDTTHLDSDTDQVSLARPALLAAVQRINDLESAATDKGASLVTYGEESVRDALDARLPEIATYAALRAYDGPRTAHYVTCREHIFDGGAGVFRVDVSDTTSADDGGTVLVDALGRRWKREFSGPVNVRWFGAIGADTDETTRLANALTAAAGKSLRLDHGKTYRATAALVVPANTTLELNGSKIKFVFTGEMKCLDLRSGVTVRNGAVELAGSNYSGGGQFGAPIVIGDYVATTGYSGIVVDGVEVISNRPNGNGIIVTGNSNNVVLQNITFPSSADLGRPILIHWGGASAPTAGTTHPHNITIRNIRTGSMTHTAVDTACVFISAAYNVLVENVEMERCELRAVLSLFAGDYGDYYAPAAVQGLNMTGIRAVNMGARVATRTVVRIDNKSTLDPTKRVCVGPSIERAWASNTSTTEASFVVANCAGTELRNSDISGGIVCISTGAEVSRLRVAGGVYRNAVQSCISVTNGTTSPEDCIIDGVTAYNAGTGGGNHAAILVDAAKRPVVKNCVVGAASGETAAWGVRVGTSSEGAVVTDNYCRGVVGGGVAFSIGSSTTYGICKEFHGNSAVSGLQVQSGMSPQIITTMQRGTNVIRECMGGAAPTSGTWSRGDRVYVETPSASGQMGWVCVTAGTPGTWKTFGAISA